MHSPSCSYQSQECLKWLESSYSLDSPITHSFKMIVEKPDISGYLINPACLFHFLKVEKHGAASGQNCNIYPDQSLITTLMMGSGIYDLNNDNLQKTLSNKFSEQAFQKIIRLKDTVINIRNGGDPEIKKYGINGLLAAGYIMLPETENCLEEISRNLVSKDNIEKLKIFEKMVSNFDHSSNYFATIEVFKKCASKIKRIPKRSLE